MKKQSEPVEQYKPSMTEAQEMERGMKEFPVQVINGKKQYPFEQYCVDKGYISFLPNGQIQVRSAFNWARATKVYDLVQWKRAKDLEDIFEQFPEEKVAYENKLQAIFVDIRKLFTSMKTTV